MRSTQLWLLMTVGCLLLAPSALLAQEATDRPTYKPKLNPPPRPPMPKPYIRVNERVMFQGHNSSVMVAFSSDGTMLATGSSGEVKLWDVATTKQLFNLAGHTEMVWSLAFSPDGKTLATASDDKTARLWDVATGREAGKFQHTERLTSVAWAPDSKFVALGDQEGTVLLRDMANAKELAKFSVQSRTGNVSVAFTPDGKMLAAGGYRAERDSEVKVWDVASGKQLFVFQGHTGGIKAVAFCPFQKMLATASDGFTDKGTLPLAAEVKFWDVSTGQEKGSLVGQDRQSIESLSFSRDGNILATGHAGGAIKIWIVDSRKELLAIDTPPICSAALSPDGKELAAGMDKTAKLWDVRRGPPIYKGVLPAIPRRPVGTRPIDPK